jgi:hypothetical protein
MLERALDNRLLRIVVGTAIGLPITAAAVMGAIYGVIFLVGGVLKRELWAVGLGLVAVLGVMGLFGAWRRLLKTHAEMSPHERLVVRRLLGCGIVASAALAATTLYSDFPAGGIFFGVLVLGGIAFVRATPVAL